ncbi:9758_t:CDS:2 [Acaulospora morrowiae]|uniref:9758_t:CDS:1 n=1 Tax=Acaulospora morrowiae TaxID=94023 RepID=A0A9N9BYD6_9GLOM|nr:9758_t:CDS:2 [Acaulospora morrowiae]
MPEKDKISTRLPLHININTNAFGTKSSSLRKIWHDSPYRSPLTKFIKINAKFKQQILLAVLVLLFWICVYNMGHPSKVEEITYPETILQADMLSNIYPTEGDGKTTAILLNWSRLENLKIIVKHLCQYSMFKEIMIWNNDDAINLSDQDDDWIIRPMRSIYANFLRFPDLVHTNTNADAYSLTNWKWCFFDDSIDLHSCFSWVGTGAFVSRENVVRFLKMTSVTEMDPVEFTFGDMYFTTFMNQVPYQLENELQELSQKNAFSAGEGMIRNKIYMHKALLHLYDHLSRKTGTFETNELYPNIYQRDVRSPCANDRCLFLTNKHPFPDVRVFRYSPTVNISESEQMHESYYSTEHFNKHPYSHAVDNKAWTAWKPQEVIRKDDYIGLDLLFPIPFPLTFKLVVDHHRDYFSSLNIQISFDGVDDWMPLIPSPKLTIQQLRQTGIDGKKRLLLCTFQIRETGIRFVRLKSTKDWEFSYGVYDFSFYASMEKSYLEINENS